MSRVGLRASVLILLVALALPLGALLSVLAIGEAPSHAAGSFSLSGPILWKYARGSLVVAGLGVGLGLAWGFVSAYVCARFVFPGRRVLILCQVLPLAVPAYLVAYVWVDAFDDLGLRSSLLRQEGFAGLLLGLAAMPYIFLPTLSALNKIPDSMLQSARLLGGQASVVRRVVRVELPLVWPALFGGVALAAMEILADFGTVEFLAVDTWTTGLFRRWYAFGDPYGAVALAVTVVLVSASVLGLESVMRYRSRWLNSRYNPCPGVTQSLCGVRAAAVCLGLSLPVVGFIVAPFCYLAFRMLRYAEPSQASPSVVFGPLLNTAGLAVITGFMVAALGVWVTAAQRAHPGRLWELLARAGTLGYALPGSVVALGILVLQSYGALGTATTLWSGLSLLVYVYCVRFATIGSQTVHGAWAAIPRNLENQSRVLGVGPLSTFFKVSFPLLKTGLACTLVLTALDVMKELPATMLLRPFDFETLALHTYNLASDERLAEAAPSALLMMGLGMALVLAAARFGAFGWSKSGKAAAVPHTAASEVQA